MARRVSVEDPPAELDTPLPEQIPPEMQQRLAEQRKALNKSPRQLLLESSDQNRCLAHMHQDVKKTSRQQHQGVLRSSKKESQSDVSRAEAAETSRHQLQDQAGLGNDSAGSKSRVRKCEIK